ncbi:hypothetical protein CBA19CS22_38055 [Caballeronia novacaledonica]|uniref:Uncharacterized protein n=1 Tax=Caballeronia novacaledonica TaxID=1544861 RepID=A0ACB5R562_9BURK|nr:hypothetical protein CBA19CS22_38055 [Caballeronia novacaledonica]
MSNDALKPCQCCGNADIGQVMFSVYVEIEGVADSVGPHIRCQVCGSMRLSNGPKFGIDGFYAQKAAWSREAMA